MYNYMYQFEIDIVVFMTSDAASRANLIDWWAGSWTGVPGLKFHIYFWNISLKATLIY